MVVKEVTPSEYLENIVKVLAEVKALGMAKGKLGTRVSNSQQLCFARLSWDFHQANMTG